MRDDEDAKRVTADLIGQFGWPAERIVDLGGLSAARGTEPLMLHLLPLHRSVGHLDFSFAVHGRRAL